MSLFFRLFLSLGVIGMVSCGKAKTTTEQEEVARDRELDILLSAIRTIQDRYVDVERTEMDVLIAASLKGIVESVDPYAQLMHTNAPPTNDSIPDDISVLEINTHEESGLLVIKVFGFTSALPKQTRALESTCRHLKPKGIMLDFRGAYGDDYETVISIAEWLLPRHTMIGRLVDRQGERVRDITTRRPPFWSEPPLVVLIDRETSGPAEWLAAALKYHDRATLVGETSRGMTMIQRPVQLNPEWLVMLSVGRAIDPAGRDVTGNALQPDVTDHRDPTNKENIDWIHHLGLTTLKSRMAD